MRERGMEREKKREIKVEGVRERGEIEGER